MARLTAAARAALPDRAFAYVDSAGRRRLPICDASHVRNALARFDQVHFETETARERARKRLLNAAKRYQIVPVGFISSQLEVERRRASGPTPADRLPTGFVTMMMTDIEGSTGLLDRVGEHYGDLLDRVRDVQRTATLTAGGCVVEERADEFFGVFESPAGGLDAATRIQRGLAELDGEPVRVRVGLHAGYPTRRGANYVGMAVHTVARVANAAHGGQILVSDDTRLALEGMVPAGLGFRSRGTHRLRGLPGPIRLFQVTGPDLPRAFPPVRT
jgi:class 3 adenylate cyclase